MAWTYWPLTTGGMTAKGLQDVAVWQELQTAFDQRAGAAGIASVTVPGANAGERIYRALDIYNMQLKARAIALAFIDHTDNGGDWHGDVLGAFAPNYTWNSGANGILGPTRANVGDGSLPTRIHGAAEPWTTVYGWNQMHDLAGIYSESGVAKLVPLWNEIYRVLDWCRWTRKTYSYGAGSPWRGDQISATGVGGTKAAAYADMLANWDGLWDAPSSDLWYASRWAIVSTDWWCQGTNDRVNLCVENAALPALGIQRSCDYYMLGQDPVTYGNFDWDDDGLGYLPSVCNNVTTAAEAGTTELWSDYIGNFPTAQDIPNDPIPPASIRTRGWMLYGLDGSWRIGGVIKWDGLNGFTSVS